MIIRDNRFDSTDTAKVLCSLIQSQLEMEPGTVMIYNQKWDVPPDSRMYASVAFEWQKPFGVNIQVGDSGEKQPDNTTGLVETVSMNVQERYVVTLYSKSSEARVRCNELILAFNSTESQQVQERYSLKIANIGDGPVDISHGEGAALIYAFSVRITILRAYEKTRVIDYFDKFPVPPEIFTNQ